MRTKFAPWLVGLAIVALAAAAGAAEFYPIDSVVSDTSDTDYYPDINLIEGPGVGFDTASPHDVIAGATTWVTDACGFPCDYIDSYGTPVLELDLGENRELSEVSVWGYASTNANGVKEFSLRFASAADGPAGFGSSIAFSPTYSDVAIDAIHRQSFPFGQR